MKMPRTATTYAIIVLILMTVTILIFKTRPEVVPDVIPDMEKRTVPFTPCGDECKG